MNEKRGGRLENDKRDSSIRIQENPFPTLSVGQAERKGMARVTIRKEEKKGQDPTPPR